MPREPGTRPPYMRGQALLPSMRWWEKNDGFVELTPSGKDSFEYKHGRHARTYSSILGCIIKKHFPGAVKMPDGRWAIAWTWRHYKIAKDPLGMKSESLPHCQARVIQEFWTYFKMDSDYSRTVCIAQSCRATSKQVTDTMHEARVGCVRRWYAKQRKLAMANKSQARDILMDPWQYLQVPPPFVGRARPGVYRAMVHWWTSAEFKRRHIEGQIKRAAMKGGSHTQGSKPMAVIMHNKTKELGTTPSMFKVWNEFHQKKNKDGTLTWVSENAELKDKEYRAGFAESYGEANPETEPFDPKVAMRRGGGRKNGCLWMCDSVIDPRTVRSMREIKGDSSSSSITIQSRPTPSSISIEKLREDLENEKRERERRETEQAQALIDQRSQMMTQQNKMMEWFAQRMTAYESQLSAFLSSGTTLPRVDPPSFNLSDPLLASGGSNNAELGGRSSQDETMQTPPTRGNPDNPLARSLF